MMEQILASENLQAAWRRVKANAGAPGIDGMTVAAFPAFGRTHWARICSALMSGTRRRHLLALGTPRDEVRMATRSRKGYWRMSGNRLVQQALTNRWLHEQGVPDMRTSWITLHYGPDARV